MTGLRLEQLRVAYDGQEVLHALDLSVPAGELLVVLGPSGSGKSTMLRAIAGLQPLTSGRVHIAGRDVTRVRPGQRNVSMVFQSFALFPHLSVMDNIAFGLEVRDTPRPRARERAREAARTAGCEAFLDRRPPQLSGGERQRVALARALAREPDLYLLDEPLSNLDAELRVQTRTELKTLHARSGGTMVHVTHDQTEALVLGDRIAVLRDGQVEQVGTPEEIWWAPASVGVARAVGTPAMNLLPGSGPFRPAGTTGAEHLVGLRPDAVLLGSTGVRAIVSRVDLIGADAHVYLDLEGGTPSEPLPQVVARVPAAGRPAPGDRLLVDAAAGDLHLFDAGSGRRTPR